MRRSLIVLAVIAGIVLLIYFMFSGAYNNMVTKSENASAKWSMVESQYQRRMDMYGSIESTIKSSANFEKTTLIGVVEARKNVSDVKVDPSKLTPESIQKFQEAQANMASSFSRMINVVVEQYPQIQTTQQYKDFQENIAGTENRINKARDDFNEAVQNYNTYIKRFPNNVISGMFGFTEKGYFKAMAGSDAAPKLFQTEEKKPEIQQ